MREQVSHRQEGIESKKLIAGAKSFEELYCILDQIGEVPGSQKVYSAARLKEKIEEVKKILEQIPQDERKEYFHGSLLDGITRTHGLRDKVRELLSK